MISDLIHKEAVVTDDDNATSEVGQILFQHLQGQNIKVIRRLVKDKKVRFLNKHSTQIKPSALASTQLRNGCILSLGREQKLRQQLPSTQSLAITSHTLKGIGNILYNIYYPLIIIKQRVTLTIITKAHRLTNIEMTTIGHLFAKKHTQECSLTDAILSDNTYLIMTRKNIVEVLQDNLISISLANAVRFKNLLTNIGITSTAELQTSRCPRAS